MGRDKGAKRKKQLTKEEKDEEENKESAASEVHKEARTGLIKVAALVIIQSSAINTHHLGLHRMRRMG